MGKLIPFRQPKQEDEYLKMIIEMNKFKEEKLKKEREFRNKQLIINQKLNKDNKNN